MPSTSVTARVALLLLAAAVAVSGCGEAAGPQAQPTAAATTANASTPAATTATSPHAVPVPENLKFTATTIDGKAFDAATLSGKPVVLWFWAAWCPRCRAKAVDVASVQRDLAGKVHVVGVAGLGSGDAAMAKFATDTGIAGLVNLADDKGEVWKKFGVTTQEYFVVLDKTGAVVHKGPLTGADLRQRATALAG